MKRNLIKWIVGLQIGSTLLTGCAPTQPFFIGERGELAHYIDRVHKIEYPDLQREPIAEVTQSLPPISLDNLNFEFTDLTLEECISYALNNTQIVRTLPGTLRQNADMSAFILSTPSPQVASIYDPALTANTTNSQPLVVDGNGNRILARGAVRANQVGGVEDALSEFDAQYSAFMSYNTTDRPRNVVPGVPLNPQFFQGRDGTGQMALSKRMATGGVVTLRSQTVYSNNNIPNLVQGQLGAGRVTPSDFTQSIEFQVQHPLMRGRGALVNRIPVVLARINEDISLTQYEERIRNLARDVEFAYWDLYAAYWTFETAKTARDAAAVAYKIANQKYLQGAAANAKAQAGVQLNQAEAQVLSSLVGGSGNDPGLLGREQALRFLMGWSATDGRLIRPSDKPAVARAYFDWDTIVGEALTRNVDIRSAKWFVKQKELELISSKNQLLPEVNLTLLARAVGVGSRWLDNDGSNPPFPTGPNASAWEELLEGNYQEGGIRLDVIPQAVGSRRALTDVAGRRLDLAKANRVLEDKEMALVAQLTDKWQEIEGLHSQMIVNYQAYNNAEDWVAATDAQFTSGASNGQSNPADELLRAQQLRAQAGQLYFRTLAEYNKALVEMHMLKGSLLEYNNILMEEDLWPEKAYWDAHERARERDAARFMSPGASRPRVVSQGEFEQFTGNAEPLSRPIKQPSVDRETQPREPVPAVPESEVIPPDRRTQAIGSGRRY
ncbi:MAG: TolC family protein [Pirellula sp.]|jgi:outer membrane protein TolC|nr:TolC family protein [Pirellula sp.]